MEQQKVGRDVRHGGPRRLRRHCLAAIAAATAIFSIVANPAGAQTVVTPAPAVTPLKTLTIVNNGGGHQTDPHVSGDLVSYTSSVNGTTQVRCFDLATSIDLGIPTTGSSLDFLSEVSGNRIVFTRVDSGKQAIHAFDVTTSGPAVELAPLADSSRRAAAIDANTVAWQELGFGTGGILSAEIVAYDLLDGGNPRDI